MVCTSHYCRWDFFVGVLQFRLNSMEEILKGHHALVACSIMLLKFGRIESIECINRYLHYPSAQLQCV